MDSIDLNADVGEGCGDDAAILACVSSANVACGAHAGDDATMAATVRAALAAGVAVGAHPGYADREHFGRRELQLPTADVYRSVRQQIQRLAAIVHAQGGRLAHVKPHGALYNQAARDAALAACVLDAIVDTDATLAVVGLSGGVFNRLARQRGLHTVDEVFADRGYLADGRLAPRGSAGALIDDIDQALAQTLRLVREGRVRALDGSDVALAAGSVCLHGDGAHALDLARRLRALLQEQGMTVRPPINR